MRLRPFSRFSIGALLGCLAGCNVAKLPVPSPDGGREQTLGQICVANLNITGTFTPGQARPVDVLPTDCWPDGTWTIRATVADTDCPSNLAPALLPQYVFSVAVDIDNNYTYTYTTDPTYTRRHMVVTAGGGAICEGTLTLYSPDGKLVTNLSSALAADNSISGHGEYEVYGSDQW